MIQIDRMQLDDAGGNPVVLAQAVIKQIPDLKLPIPVRSIAKAVDIREIREEPLDNFEGVLITDAEKSSGSILVNAVRAETRKRYTIGHELGHYLNLWHKPAESQGFRCRPQDMAAEKFGPSDRAGKMEVEANEFAAELLMPTSLVKSFLNRLKGLDIDHIKSMASSFDVSREAAARRYVIAQDEPSALVFSKNGIIRYVKKHQYFPSLNVWKDDSLPTSCISKRSTLPIGKVSDWDTVDAGIWLTQPKGRRICEQTLAQENGFRMTLLVLEDQEPDDDERNTDWHSPTFHR